MRLSVVVTTTVAVIILSVLFATPRRSFVEVRADYLNCGFAPFPTCEVNTSLYATVPGWNSSESSGSNPDITVKRGQTVHLSLISGDASSHLFILDVDQHGPGTACSGQDKCSGITGQDVPFSLVVDFAAGSYKYYCYYHPLTMVGTFYVQAVPDFTTSPNPSSLTLVPASHGSSTVTITSQVGLAGNVSISASPTPRIIGLIASMNPSTVDLPANGTATSTLSITVDDITPPRTYNVTVTMAGPLGPGGGLPSRSTVIQVVVSPPPNTGGILLYEATSGTAVAVVVVGAILYFFRKSRGGRLRAFPNNRGSAGASSPGSLSCRGDSRRSRRWKATRIWRIL